MDIKQILQDAITQNSSDVFIVAGMPVAFKINGQIKSQGEMKLTPDMTKELIGHLYSHAKRDAGKFLSMGDDDFSFAIAQIGRFRVNVYRQRNSEAAVIRIVRFELPDPGDMGIPPQVVEVFKQTKGLVLVTGPTGSGKSTTLSCIIDKANKNRSGHIITLEDPIEFIHRHDQCIVSQREIGIDTESYTQGLRAALREVPDIILLGEMRDFETIGIAMTAAETGQLVFSSLHTLGAVNTIDRIIDVFPPNQQQQIRVQLAMVLQAVVSQQLIPVEDRLEPVFEIMFMNNAIRNMIRESKVHQLESVIQTYASEGMCTMDGEILKLYQQGKIAKDTAKFYSINPDMMTKRLQML